MRSATIKVVIDSRTFEIEQGMPVRLAGIPEPQRRSDSDRRGCRKLQGLLSSGTEIAYEHVAWVAGREMAQVWRVDDGLHINQAMKDQLGHPGGRCRRPDERLADGG